MPDVRALVSDGDFQRGAELITEKSTPVFGMGCLLLALGYTRTNAEYTLFTVISPLKDETRMLERIGNPSISRRKPDSSNLMIRRYRPNSCFVLRLPDVAPPLSSGAMRDGRGCIVTA